MKPRIPRIPLLALSLLLIPFSGMLFTREVNWSAGDFLVMGAFLLALGFGLDRALRRTKTWKNKVLYMALIVLAFLFVWAELAVGIFGTPLAGN